jgi:hypothetical protein
MGNLFSGSFSENSPSSGLGSSSGYDAGFVDLKQTYSIKNGYLNCTLNTYDKDTIITPESMLKMMTADPIRQANFSMILGMTYPKPKTVVADLIAINVPSNFKVKSLNKGTQHIIMSSDSKYIFFDPNSIDMKLPIISNQYDIPLPDVVAFNTLMMLAMFGKYEPKSDNIYNTLTEMTKILYKCYLIGIDPPNELLSIISNKDEWIYAGIYYRALYLITIQNKFNEINNYCVTPALNVTNTSNLKICRSGETSTFPNLNLEPIPADVLARLSSNQNIFLKIYLFFVNNTFALISLVVIFILLVLFVIKPFSKSAPSDASAPSDPSDTPA